jgi:hypothetical protein
MSSQDRWLTVAEQANLLGIKPGSIPQYVQRYGPDHPNPYPAHVEGQHKRFGRSTAVSETALRAWNARRPGVSPGRPRIIPPSLSAALHQALRQIDRGEAPAPRHVVALAEHGLVRTTHGRFILTSAGRAILDAYPVPDRGEQ